MNYRDKEELPSYSVLMSVYERDDPAWLGIALDSMLSQTIEPSQFIVVCDGPLSPELHSIVETYDRLVDQLEVIYLEKNGGLPHALNVGIERCTNELVVRMDADDYSLPSRCELQILYAEEHNLDVIGCNVDEFVGEVWNTTARVRLPETHEEIAHMARRRNPMRHPAMLVRRSALIAIDGYDETLINAQDYDLVVRLIMAGYRCGNLQQALVRMRVGEGFYKRRGGREYYKRIKRVKRKLLDMGFYSKADYALGIAVHWMSCAMPDNVRSLVYEKLLRS